MTAPAETTYRAWTCQTCHLACRIDPTGAAETGCRCERPVPSLRPTTVTQVSGPKHRPVHALSDDEARLHGLIAGRCRLRITFEADITQAWTSNGPSGRELHLIVTTPDGRRHSVRPSMPGVTVEAAGDDR